MFFLYNEFMAVFQIDPKIAQWLGGVGASGAGITAALEALTGAASVITGEVLAALTSSAALEIASGVGAIAGVITSIVLGSIAIDKPFPIEINQGLLYDNFNALYKAVKTIQLPKLTLTKEQTKLVDEIFGTNGLTSAYEDALKALNEINRLVDIIAPYLIDEKEYPSIPFKGEIIPFIGLNSFKVLPPRGSTIRWSQQVTKDINFQVIGALQSLGLVPIGVIGKISTSSGVYIPLLEGVTAGNYLEIINKIIISLIATFHAMEFHTKQKYEEGIAAITLEIPGTNPYVIPHGWTTKEIDEMITNVGLGLLSGEYLKELLRSLSKTRTSTRTKTKKRAAKKRKKTKKKWKKKGGQKKKKKKNPKYIKMITVDVNNVSRWIARVEFFFPVRKPLESDDKGTMIFHLKKGGNIKFVRVKRGTFSVISQVYGTGYRVWSQFWKKKIVNRTVLSWFIKRINMQDREIAIPQEIKSKKVKYK